MFASVVAFYFWSKAIAQVGPSRAGMYMHIMPLAGTILSITLLGEEIAPFHLVGAALVFTGIAITNWQSPATRPGRWPGHQCVGLKLSTTQGPALDKKI